MLLMLVMSTLMTACAVEPRACKQEYSARGDSKAIQELIADFQATIRLVQEQKNLVLLSHAQAITRSRSLVAMEEWTCRAQKLYGTPSR